MRVNGATYDCSAWIYLENAASAPVAMTMSVTDQVGTTYTGISYQTVTDSGWTPLSGSFTLNYTGSRSDFVVYV